MKKLFLLMLLLPLLSLVAYGQAQLATTAARPTPKNEVIVLPEILNKYAGVYELNQNFKITISVEKDKLFALAPGDQDKTEFTPTSNTKFFTKDSGAEIEFIAENGKHYLLVKMQEVLKLIKNS